MDVFWMEINKKINCIWKWCQTFLLQYSKTKQLFAEFVRYFHYFFAASLRTKIHSRKMWYVFLTKPEFFTKHSIWLVLLSSRASPPFYNSIIECTEHISLKKWANTEECVLLIFSTRTRWFYEMTVRVREKATSIRKITIKIVYFIEAHPSMSA